MECGNCIDLWIQLQKEMAEFLIENDADVNSTCTNLKTPLQIALMLNHEEFVHLLLQNGASLNAKDQDKINLIEEGLMRKQMTAFKTMIAYTQFLKSKDWKNDGLVATPKHVLSKSHGQVSSVEMYFNDFSK